MPGFLDKSAPSIDVEYSRYMDSDILGKIITKNFLINRLGYKQNQIYIPVGRFGDAAVRYSTKGVKYESGDGILRLKNRSLIFEIKCARINIANRHLGHIQENWAFANLLKTSTGDKRKYDVLILIGVMTLGLEDSEYWEHLKKIKEEYYLAGRKMVIKSRPHEKEFLSICSFFVIPFSEVPNNYFRCTIRRILKNKFSKYQSWGDDISLCKQIWNYAAKTREK